MVGAEPVSSQHTKAALERKCQPHCVTSSYGFEPRHVELCMFALEGPSLLILLAFIQRTVLMGCQVGFQNCAMIYTCMQSLYAENTLMNSSMVWVKYL